MPNFTEDLRDEFSQRLTGLGSEPVARFVELLEEVLSPVSVDFENRLACVAVLDFFAFVSHRGVFVFEKADTQHEAVKVTAIPICEVTSFTYDGEACVVFYGETSTRIKADGWSYQNLQAFAEHLAEVRLSNQ